MTLRNFTMCVVAMGVVASEFAPQPSGAVVFGLALSIGLVIGGMVGFSYALYLGEKQKEWQ